MMTQIVTGSKAKRQGKVHILDIEFFHFNLLMLLHSLEFLETMPPSNVEVGSIYRDQSNDILSRY